MMGSLSALVEETLEVVVEAVLAVMRLALAELEVTASIATAATTAEVEAVALKETAVDRIVSLEVATASLR